MSNQQTGETIRQYLLREAPNCPVTLDDDLNLFEAGVLDSFRILSMVMFLEETYGLTFDHSDLTEENFRSIGALTRLLTARRSVAER